MARSPPAKAIEVALAVNSNHGGKARLMLANFNESGKAWSEFVKLSAAQERGASPLPFWKYVASAPSKDRTSISYEQFKEQYEKPGSKLRASLDPGNAFPASQSKMFFDIADENDDGRIDIGEFKRFWSAKPSSKGFDIRRAALKMMESGLLRCDCRQS